MLNRLLKKIISTSIGRINYVLAVTGLFVSVLLIFAALQISHNFQTLQRSSNEYLIVTKKITNDMMADVNMSYFTPQEMADIKAQPYFDSVQPIKTSLFRVKMDIALNSLPLNTDLFFEAVPDAYLDVKPDNWGWSPDKPRISLILPRFMLDLYNYGMAIGQQFPQLNPESAKRLPLNFHITDKFGMPLIDLKGNIVAFSDRFSSLLVPESFLDWANQHYGFKQLVASARLVVKAKNPTSSEMNSYLKSKGWVTDYGIGRFSKLSGIIHFIEKIIAIVGAALFLFALLVFIMFIQLTVTNAKNEIQLLHTLGAAPKQLRGFLMRQLLPVYFSIIIIALLIIQAAQVWLSVSPGLKEQEIFLKPWLGIWVIGCAAALMGLLWFLNSYTVKKQLGKTARG